MLKNCGRGPRPIRLCVERLKILMKFDSGADLSAKMGQNFDRPLFPKFEAP